MRISRTLTTPSCEISQSDDEIAEHLKNGFIFPAASPVMAKICSSIEQVARVDVPVLLLGESGVGKEVVARRIYQLSKRAHRSFLKVNCAALPGELLESELFGYEAGAFTGATRAKPGLFELCNKGTLLLDEIGELPAALQAKLLHVLQGGQFSRLGGRSVIEVDVRIVAATNVDVPQALASKQLRQDLYYRLSALTIHLPPLRKRPEEIPVFLKYFMQRLAAQLGCAAKPYTDRVLDACDVRHAQVLPAAQPDNVWSLRTVKAEAEREAILAALEQTRWRRKDAAIKLRISLKALYNKLRLYGIDPQDHSAVAHYPLTPPSPPLG